ncbi:CHAT domain-containing protein [Aquimarina sp. TRL1]|uniref:CHAT domain-containing protein n=1 Tax=Aquimarina sp. (strain TRL1) TaxID=2736252 RepID=UPI00158B9FFC|nr:CHAT domain-containing tetratricopeptide repeat protein [Aquimarina sp. TRL1]QKX05902.1 CHAT domain-containing protein [Aquimarina sp. TRL1]
MLFGNSKQTAYLVVRSCCFFFMFSPIFSQSSPADTLLKELIFLKQTPSIERLHTVSKNIQPITALITTEKDYYMWLEIQNNLGYYYQQFGYIAKAITHYEIAWNTYRSHAVSKYDIIEYCLQPLGNLYIKIGDLQKAERIITYYIYQSEKEKNTEKVITGITNLSVAYNNSGTYEKAIQLLKKGLLFDSKNINLQINMATNYLHQGNWKLATRYAQSVISIAPEETQAYTILAAIAIEQKAYDAAEKHLKHARNLLAQKSNTTGRTLIQWELHYTELLVAKSLYKKALSHISYCYTHLFPGIAIENGLPSKKINNADPILLAVLDIQAHIYQSMGAIEKANETYEVAFALQEKLTLFYPLQETKLIQHYQHRKRVEKYLQQLYHLYQNTSQQSYLEKAFIMADKSKSPFLTASLFSKKFMNTYQHDTLVVQKQKLQEEIALFSTQIIKEKLKGPTSDIFQIQQWNLHLEQLSSTYRNITQTLTNTYKQLLPHSTPLSISDLQEHLANQETTLISYFFGEEDVFQFQVTQDHISMHRLGSATQIKEKAISFIRFFHHANTITDDISSYTHTAHDTYTMLHLPLNTNKIVLITDGLLNFIPFEALLTTDTKSIQFQEMPFLIKKSHIHHEISAVKYVHATRIQKAKDKTVLGVFPIFEGTASALPYSKKELNSIKQYFSGQFLTRQHATYKNFKANSLEHDILHLSTHASSGTLEVPASIRFSDENVLVNQLYGLSLQAEIAILSACETGIGKISKGEGPISIARGFQYAGVENIIFSLWKVHDKTASLFMEKFYNKLYNQSPVYTEALHFAKIDYLQDPVILNAQKSPYYWGAFVFYGTPVTIEASGFTPLLAGAVILILLIIIGIVYYTFFHTAPLKNS